MRVTYMLKRCSPQVIDEYLEGHKILEKKVDNGNGAITASVNNLPVTILRSPEGDDVATCVKANVEEIVRRHMDQLPDFELTISAHNYPD